MFFTTVSVLARKSVLAAAVVALTATGSVAANPTPAQHQEAVGPQLAQAPEQVVQQPVTYPVNGTCRTGSEITVVVGQPEVKEALDELFAGVLSPAEFLDYISQNYAEQVSQAVSFLDTCMQTKFKAI